VLANRYRLERPLARGGMGSVWKAEHLTLGSEVAVKIIDPRVASRELGVTRFLREAQALAALRSPHIVQVSDFGSEGDIVYLVMELLEGRTLGQRLKAEGKLSAHETNRILSQVCKAMSHAHARGIVHRDLKPDNIFLCDASREYVTKVVDFGIAKSLANAAASETGTEAGSFLGTPSYMSPEQCRDVRNLDPRSDLWALGAIAYECLLGKRLFQGEVIGDLVVRICTEALPVEFTADQLPGFDDWLHKAMARNPNERFQSAGEFSRALAAALDTASESARSVDSAETLEVDGGPASLVPDASAGHGEPGSTLENGSVARSTARQQRGERAIWRLAAAGAGLVALVIGAVTLLRSGASHSPVAPTEARRDPAAVPARPLRFPDIDTGGAAPGLASNLPPGPSRSSNEAKPRAPDAGLAPAAPRRRVRKPALVSVPSTRDAARDVPGRPAEAAARQPDPPATDALRKKR